MTTINQAFGISFLEGLKDNARVAKGLGIFILVCGALAVAMPFVTAVSITIIIGFLMLVGGIAEVVLAFKAGAFGRGLLVFLIGLLKVAVGLYMLGNPVPVLAAMTLFLAAYFMVDGIVDLVSAIRLRPVEAWGWMLFLAIVTFSLGLMIWVQFPVSGVYAIGILFGIKLLVSGAALIGLGTVVSRGVKHVEAR